MMIRRSDTAVPNPHCWSRSGSTRSRNPIAPRDKFFSKARESLERFPERIRASGLRNIRYLPLARRESLFAAVPKPSFLVNNVYSKWKRDFRLRRRWFSPGSLFPTRTSNDSDPERFCKEERHAGRCLALWKFTMMKEKRTELVSIRKEIPECFFSERFAFDLAPTVFQSESASPRPKGEPEVWHKRPVEMFSKEEKSRSNEPVGFPGVFLAFFRMSNG